MKRILAVDTLALALCVTMVLIALQDGSRLALTGWAAAGIIHVLHVAERHFNREDTP